MSASVEVKTRPLGAVAAAIRPQVQANLAPRAQRVTSLARSLAPVRTGKLRGSIRLDARDALGRYTSIAAGNPPICAYEISVNVSYAAYVIHGTRPHVIRSRGPWPLRNRLTGQVFGPKVNHPGTKPNDFLQRALREGMG